VVADWIKQGLSRIAEAADGGLEGIPLERLLTGHLGFLTELRGTGATWAQIARALSAHGIMQRSGRPLSSDQVRGVYSRLKSRERADPVAAGLASAAGKPVAKKQPSSRLTQSSPPAAFVPNKPDRPDPANARATSIAEKLARIARIRDESMG
jgi:hypothetical protein